MRLQPMDIALRIGLVAALIYGCYAIVAPFVHILIWAVVLAVMLYPLHLKLRHWLGHGSRANALAATLIALAGTLLILVPVAIALDSLAQSLYTLVVNARDGTMVINTPPSALARLPIIGSKLTLVWSKAAADLPGLIKDHAPFLKDTLTWGAKFVGGLFTALLSFVAALLIAAVLLAFGAEGAQVGRDIFVRIAGDGARAERLLVLTTKTIRGVAMGIVGVAFIQAVLLGIGFFAIGLPGAGAWALTALLLGIVQLPTLLVVVPAIVLVFATHSPTATAVFTVWMLLAGLSDNILKPLLLGRGLNVPMPVILIGVIGGLLAGGLVGMFTGPVLLAVGFMLFMEWVREPVAQR